MSGSRPWLRRTLLALGALAAGLAVVYLAGANLFLNSRLAPRWINAKPEKLQVTWESAWTVVPGWVHARGVEVRGQDRKIQWYVALDDVRVRTILPAFAARRFEASSVEGSGLVFRLRRRVEDGGPEGGGEDVLTPPIPGLQNPPENPPEKLYPRKGKRDRRGWVIDLDDVAISGVREIWIETSRLVGAGEIAGHFRFEVRGPLAIEQATFELPSGRLLVGEDSLAEELSLSLAVDIEPFVPREVTGRRIFASVSGSLELRAEEAGLGFVNYYLRQAPDVRLDGRGSLAAAIGLDRGRLTPDSRLDFAASPVSAAFLDYEATGTGSLEGRIEPREGAPHGVVTVTFREFGVARRDLPGTYLEGEGLTIEAATADLDLTDPFTDLEVALDLPESEIPDVSYYNHYLPAGAGFTLLGGRGRMRGHFELSTAGGTAHGGVTLTGRRLTARFDDLLLTGDLTLDSRLASTALAERRFDLAGTTLAVERVAVTPEGDPAGRRDWWARVDLPRGTIRMGGSPRLDATVAARLKDTRPLVAIFAEENKAVRLFRGLLGVENLAATGNVRLDGDAVILTDLDVRGDRLEVLGRLKLGEGPKNGLLYAKYGPLSVAVELDGTRRDWKLFRSKKWYLRKAGA